MNLASSSYYTLDTPTPLISFFFFFNDTATTEIYTLSLHDALPICRTAGPCPRTALRRHRQTSRPACPRDRKSTRLNSSHLVISYAVFCLKKKKNNDLEQPHEEPRAERDRDRRVYSGDDPFALHGND